MRIALTVTLALCGCAATEEQEAAPRRPNFVIVLADDMGYGDSSVYDGWIETPALERMAREGLAFTDFHSSGVVCSPTRAGLVTGRYQERAGLGVVVNADPAHPDHGRGLMAKEVTFAELLLEAGYRTALFGKWHLGYSPEFNPIHHGFERFHGFKSGNIDYRSHYDRMGTPDWWEGAERIVEEGYLTDLVTAQAVEFLRAHADEPFCLLIAHGAVHTPLQGPASPPLRGPDAQRDPDPRPKDELARAMMVALDRGVGEVLDALVELGIEQNTCVLFFSDNGAAPHMSSGPLRGRKGSVWEGGHRVPAIAWWPGAIAAGGVSDELCISLDVMPTFLALAGVEPPANRPLDGVDLSKQLLAGGSLEPRQLAWRGRALRDGAWKLVQRGEDDDPRYALFDLRSDLGEREDLAAREPGRVAEMAAALATWRQDVRAEDGDRAP